MEREISTVENTARHQVEPTWDNEYWTEDTPSEYLYLDGASDEVEGKTDGEGKESGLAGDTVSEGASKADEEPGKEEKAKTRKRSLSDSNSDPPAKKKYEEVNTVIISDSESDDGEELHSSKEEKEEEEQAHYAQQQKLSGEETDSEDESYLGQYVEIIQNPEIIVISSSEEEQ